MNLVSENYNDSEAASLFVKLKPKIAELFADLEIKPSLLHGDLWSGNVGEANGEGGMCSKIHQVC